MNRFRKFSVQEDGLYDLRMIYKQDQIVNGYTYRTLKIDGEYPFKEAESLKFYYGTSWQTYTLQMKMTIRIIFI